MAPTSLGACCRNCLASLPPWRLLFTAMGLTVVAYFPVGFHHCVMNVAYDVFQRLINESYMNRYSSGEVLSGDQMASLWSTTVSSWQIGSGIGAINAFWIADRFGRKYTLTVITGSCQLAASISMILALEYRHFELLIIGRLLSGIGTGVVCIVLRVFIGECSPDLHRGTLNSLAGFVLSIAVVLAMVLGLPEVLGDGSELNSQLLLGFCIPFNILQLVAFPCFLETPKFLHLTRHDHEAAKASIAYYHGREADTKAVFDELEEEKKLAGVQMSFLQALHLKSVRLPLILSAVAGVCDSSTGVDLADNYSAELYTKLGLPAWEAKLCSILMNVAAMAGATISVMVIDRCRRRTLLLSNLSACFILNVAIVTLGGVVTFGAGGKHPAFGFGVTAAILISVMQFSYSIGPGATLEPLFAEVSPHRVRAIAGSISEVSNAAVKSLYVFIYPIIAYHVDTVAFLLHTIPLGLCIVYFYFYLPETGKHSVAHIINNMISKKSGSRKSLTDKRNGSKAVGLTQSSDAAERKITNGGELLESKMHAPAIAGVAEGT